MFVLWDLLPWKPDCQDHVDGKQQCDLAKSGMTIQMIKLAKRLLRRSDHAWASGVAFEKALCFGLCTTADVLAKPKFKLVHLLVFGDNNYAFFRGAIFV